jgi:lipoprotein-anchoring transpeptidase ErfK/SrfK
MQVKEEEREMPLQSTEVASCPIGTSPYIVRPGDTLASIASIFSTTIQTIIATNPGIDPFRLFIGQKICISQPKADVTVCSSLNTYVVRSGDTFYNIAKAFGVSVRELTEINPKIKSGNIYEGLVICLPIAPTLFSIVVRINRRVLDLYKSGRFINSYRVAVGKPSTSTPVGTFTIVNKQVNPGGPFGTRWMGLSEPTYGIHGTNNPDSIGYAASNGCIRMYNNSVEELFNIVPVGTVVRMF